jgi:hypothetical protein
MILSVHIADVGLRETPAVLRARPRGDGLRWGLTVLTAPLAAGPGRRPKPGRVGFMAGWDDDAALDRFLAEHPLAGRLRGGWHTRLEPLRASGAWSPLPGLSVAERPVADDEPVAILTLARLRLMRIVPFLRASVPAERGAVEHPAVVASTAFARPPRIVSTFSLWRTAAEMREYAYGRERDAHIRAVRSHQANPFHHESVFARFRPYAQQGTWNDG